MRDYFKRPIQSDRLHHEYGHNRLGLESRPFNRFIGECLVLAGFFILCIFLVAAL